MFILNKGIISLEFILCVLIIIIVLGFVIDINLQFKERLENIRNITVEQKEIKKEYLKQNNWEKNEEKRTDYDS